MTLDSVMSSVGGAMGVCLGASLITLTELLVFLCQLCLKTIHWSKQNLVVPDGPDSNNRCELVGFARNRISKLKLTALN